MSVLAIASEESSNIGYHRKKHTRHLTKSQDISSPVLSVRSYKQTSDCKSQLSMSSAISTNSNVTSGTQESLETTSKASNIIRHLTDYIHSNEVVERNSLPKKSKRSLKSLKVSSAESSELYRITSSETLPLSSFMTKTRFSSNQSNMIPAQPNYFKSSTGSDIDVDLEADSFPMHIRLVNSCDSSDSDIDMSHVIAIHTPESAGSSIPLGTPAWTPVNIAPAPSRDPVSNEIRAALQVHKHVKVGQSQYAATGKNIRHQRKGKNSFCKFVSWQMVEGHRSKVTSVYYGVELGHILVVCFITFIVDLDLNKTLHIRLYTLVAIWV